MSSENSTSSREKTRGGTREWRREQVLGTRAHLLETAAKLFGAQGFARTPLEQVVREAGLTRGAVYHHFKDKQALFDTVADQALRAVVERVEYESLRRAAEQGGERPGDVLELFLDELSDGPARQILSLDAPAVLGRERWAQLLAERLMEPVERIVRGGGDGPAPELVPVVSHLLVGALQQAALLVGGGTAGIPRDRVDEGVRWLLSRVLRADGAGSVLTGL